ncbi:hypothetical protein ABIE66_000158 [Peribacillus sp. B2I2]|uniref:hypothetical protein n=1 Tax=Peribacillus sp. B2I2 TaxID=3156468 RepID=UPI00351406FF
MKKTIWPIIAVFVMLVCFPEVNSSAESLQKDLTQEGIYQKLSEISDYYDVGEELSFDDAESLCEDIKLSYHACKNCHRLRK